MAGVSHVLVPAVFDWYLRKVLCLHSHVQTPKQVWLQHRFSSGADAVSRASLLTDRLSIIANHTGDGVNANNSERSPPPRHLCHRHSQASEGVRDLIRRMLCPDPRARITVPEIMAHPWFCTDLPAGVTDLNETLLATAAAAEVDAYDAAGFEGTVRPPS